MYDYDYNQNSDSYTPPRRSGMETAAIILGILGLVGSTCCYLAVPLGAIGIILAILSKGRHDHMSSRAKTGLLLSAGSLILTISLTGYAMYRYRDVLSSGEFQQKMKEYMEYYNPAGESEDMDDFLDEFFKDGEYDDSIPAPKTPDDGIDVTPYVENPMPDRFSCPEV